MTRQPAAAISATSVASRPSPSSAHPLWSASATQRSAATSAATADAKTVSRSCSSVAAGVLASACVDYLVPVDARLERDVDVRFEAVTVDDLLVSTSGASLRLLILDACRNNPLARSMQRTAVTRTVSGGSFADLDEGLLGDETLAA